MWKLQNGRGKEVNNVLKDFDELERTGLGRGNAIVARRYPVKYEGREGIRREKAMVVKEGGKEEQGESARKTEETLKWKTTWRSGKREASFDGPRVLGSRGI